MEVGSLGADEAAALLPGHLVMALEGGGRVPPPGLGVPQGGGRDLPGPPPPPPPLLSGPPAPPPPLVLLRPALPAGRRARLLPLPTPRAVPHRRRQELDRRREPIVEEGRPEAAGAAGRRASVWSNGRAALHPT